MEKFMLRAGLVVLCVLFGAVNARAATVIVFGAAGQLGAEVARELVAAGHDVAAFVRPSSDLARLKDIKVNLVRGDAMVEADVEAAFKAAKYEIVVDALARGKADVSFYDITERHISKWAKATGVKHMILHSSVGAGESRAVYPKSRWEAMKPTMAAKEAGENHVMATGATYTVIRNAVLRDLPPGAADKAELFEDQAKFGAVTRTGLARLTRDCIGSAKCANKIFHAVDPGVAIPE
jgi:uncharacterized protein YbjT (DUF2867 family)